MLPVSVHRDESRYVDLVSPQGILAIKHFYRALRDTGESFFLMDQIAEHLQTFLREDATLDGKTKAALQRLYSGCQEVVFLGDYTYALLRPKIGVKRMVRLHPQEDAFEEVSREHYLRVKDTFVQGPEMAGRRGLVVDFSAFFGDFPKVKDPQRMGEGISLLNRHLSGQMYREPGRFRTALLAFLQSCTLHGNNILINDYLDSPDRLLRECENAQSMLSDIGPDVPYAELAHDLRKLGFDAGWGATSGAIHEGLSQLTHVMESSDPELFERFLGRLPLIRKVVMVSPHGWFAQDDVLGKPDTGGQVTYVLDQARALEKRMQEHFNECGLESVMPEIVILTRLIPNDEGTTCSQPREKVLGSARAWIVRVPFRDEHGQILNDWVSRFRIWPYLENFAEESAAVITAEFRGKPDLIIGHYSDGNLVAHRLASDMECTHCAAVHALEKTKYLFSDMRWADMEHEYHWSCQFTADIIAYNSADYIISSSYREIGGTSNEMGMFESYECYTMPGLYRVVSGMDPQLARYNIVPPGASEEHFYPHTEQERRVERITADLEATLLGQEPGDDALGRLDNPDLPPIFAMSRLDRVKNLPGLVELYGKSESLRKSANLVFLSSLTDASQSSDAEEIEQINRIYALLDEYDLHGHVRWRGVRLDKVETGEVYRIIADRGGVFAQPAFMETFGLTVIEAMSCGLPVVVTCFGGPAEIVLPGECGEVVNPNHHEEFAAALERVVTDRDLWKSYSGAGIQRVKDAFSWGAHASKVLRLANTYAYWNYLGLMNRDALDQYVHTLYHTVYRPRAQAILGE